MGRINAYFIFTIAVIACGGIPKGYDEGGFSASITLDSFVEDYNLAKSHWKGDASGLANRKANITSFGVLGAAFGALISLYLNDRLGRLQAWRVAALVWAVGLLIQVFSSGIFGLLLFARIFSGLGAGGLTVAAPLYLSEAARAKTRGMITSIYMIFLLFFLSLGFFVNYAANKEMSTTREQYRVVQIIPLIPTGIAFICSFFLRDTPRWLASQGHHEDAMASLARLRNRSLDDPVLREELNEIETQIRIKAADLAHTNFFQIWKELVTVPTYRKRYLLVIAMHIIAQWTGGNAITYYVSTIFQSAGVGSQSISLISSGAYGLVKLVLTVLFAVVLIDMIGRRRSFIAGLFLQFVAHIYLAAYMSKPSSENSKSSSNGAIAMIFIYGAGWSIGLCTIPYIYGSEIFPTRVRNAAYASTMGLHWFLQFAVVRAMPPMFVSFDNWGVYVFFALVCFIGLIILGLWAPETKGVPMEYMEALFAGKWWLGWRAKPSDAFLSKGDVEDTKDGKDIAHSLSGSGSDVSHVTENVGFGKI